jgi:hypothetical protein
MMTATNGAAAGGTSKAEGRAGDEGPAKDKGSAATAPSGAGERAFVFDERPAFPFVAAARAFLLGGLRLSFIASPSS